MEITSQPHQEIDEIIINRIIPKIIDQINNFMLKTYPLFDNNLNNKIEEIGKVQNSIRLYFHNFECMNRESEKKAFEEMKVKLNKFIKKEFPDIEKALSTTFTGYRKIIEEHKDSMKTIQKLSDKLTVYHSLYEDIFKMRDQINKLNEFMSGFQKNMKKLFGE